MATNKTAYGKAFLNGFLPVFGWLMFVFVVLIAIVIGSIQLFVGIAAGLLLISAIMGAFNVLLENCDLEGRFKKLTDVDTIVRRLERHLNSVCLDTGLQERDLERLLFLLETGAMEVQELKEYGIHIDRYR